MLHGFIQFIFILISFASAECPLEDTVKNQYIIKLKTNDSISEKLTSQNYTIKSTIHSSLNEFDSGSSKLSTIESKILVVETNDWETLKNDSSIIYIQKDCYAQNFSINSSDPFSVLQNWYFKSLNASKNFSFIKEKDVTVAVIDSGVDVYHEDLSENVWINEAELDGLDGVDDDSNGFIDDIFGFDVADNDNDPVPTFQDFHLDFDHGTHVAGLIAAGFDNELGVTGLTRNQVKVMAVKGFRSLDRTPISDLLKGIYYAVDNGADIINASWGATKSAEPAEIDAINYALDREVLIVAAAGNSTEPASWVTPASIPGVITVASINSEEQLSTFSNYGASVNFIAPGGDGSERLNETLISTVLGDDYDGIKGTSMSAPLVSGSLALLMSQRADLSPFMALRALNSTAADVKLSSYNDRDEQIYRKPNLEDALKYINDVDEISKLDPLLLTVINPSEDLDSIELSSKAVSGGASGCNLTNSSAAQSGLKGHSLIVTFLLLLPSLVNLLIRRKKYY